MNALTSRLRAQSFRPTTSRVQEGYNSDNVTLTSSSSDECDVVSRLQHLGQRNVEHINDRFDFREVSDISAIKIPTHAHAKLVIFNNKWYIHHDQPSLLQALAVPLQMPASMIEYRVRREYLAQSIPLNHTQDILAGDTAMDITGDNETQVDQAMRKFMIHHSADFEWLAEEFKADIRIVRLDKGTLLRRYRNNEHETIKKVNICIRTELDEETRQLEVRYGSLERFPRPDIVQVDDGIGQLTPFPILPVPADNGVFHALASALSEVYDENLSWRVIRRGIKNFDPHFRSPLVAAAHTFKVSIHLIDISRTDTDPTLKIARGYICFKHETYGDSLIRLAIDQELGLFYNVGVECGQISSASSSEADIEVGDLIYRSDQVEQEGAGHFGRGPSADGRSRSKTWAASSGRRDLGYCDLTLDDEMETDGEGYTSHGSACPTVIVVSSPIPSRRRLDSDGDSTASSPVVRGRLVQSPRTSSRVQQLTQEEIQTPRRSRKRSADGSPSSSRKRRRAAPEIHAGLDVSEVTKEHIYVPDIGKLYMLPNKSHDVFTALGQWLKLLRASEPSGSRKRVDHSSDFVRDEIAKRIRNPKTWSALRVRQTLGKNAAIMDYVDFEIPSLRFNGDELCLAAAAQEYRVNIHLYAPSRVTNWAGVVETKYKLERVIQPAEQDVADIYGKAQQMHVLYDVERDVFVALLPQRDFEKVTGLKP